MILRNKNQCSKRMDSTDKIYGELIANVPEDLSVLDCLVGLHWTLVRSEKGTGMAKTLEGGECEEELRSINGMPLKELATYVKSGDFMHASLGMAAINSALNHLKNVEDITDPESPNGFNHFLSNFAGKRVATVGYFPMLDPLGEICQLSIIEREPHDNSYSEKVSHTILPFQDYVIITGTTFLYKTTINFIQQAHKARIILVGASVPLSPVLFRYGVDTLAGVVVTDEKVLWRAVREGSKKSCLTESTQSVFIQR
ncbi:MAG: hypothetical protein H6Q73_1203 [Firmicutes bacterium]|nr:hypothetical protein [Bacillota bacterium]